MKKTILTLGIALASFYSYAQWLPLSAGSGSPLTGDLFISSNNLTIQTASGAPGSVIGALKYRNTNSSGFEIARIEARQGSNINDGELGFYTGNSGSFTEKLTILKSGNVGIGTTSPLSKIHILSGTQSAIGEQANGLAIFEGPNVTNSAAILNVTSNSAPNANIGASFGFSGLYRSVLTDPAMFAKIIGAKENSTDGNYGGYLAFFSTPNGGSATERMRITSTGNVLIGKNSLNPGATYKLDVAGDVRANKIVVNTNGADFVFEPTYTLPKLSEVKSYIDENHHLPEITSAAEMQKNGMDVGELNTKLLQKVEELTLYIIQQNERINKLEESLKTDKAK